MRPRSARLLAAVAVLGVLLVVAISASRVSYQVDGVEVACPDRVGPAAVKGLTDDSSDPGYACTAESQQRLFAVAAALMGLVLISGLLSRRD